MIKSIDANTLQQWLHDGAEMALIDVREAGQFGEGHLFFAAPVPYSQLELDIGRLVPRTGTRTVVHDDGSDTLANRAIVRLQAMGYTNVHLFSGGTRAWGDAGFPVYKGVNLPSKTFGELVEHAYDTPRVTVTELDAMIKRGDDIVVLDGRTFAEYSKMSIPTGISCPNGELAYRVGEIVKSPKTTIIVNCAGRTRSILGAQTLRNFGVDNPVYALENGTQGWYLADLKLDHGADRKYPQVGAGADLSAQQAKARALAERYGVKYVDAARVKQWLGETNRNVFLCDVRTPEEFAAGSLPGAQHTPGGQFIQSTDQYVGVRNARIVVFDSDLVRAPVVASWLAQMGHEVHVLIEGVKADLRAHAGPTPQMPALAKVAPGELAAFMRNGKLIDLRTSGAFRKSHVEGARWSIRPVIGTHASGGQPIALMADDAGTVGLAATDLLAAGATDVRIVDGTLEQCAAAGVKLVATSNEPADAERIDFLFFVHDRHEGNKEAAQGYLAWETGLIKQLHDSERASFRLPAGTH
jgi:rhodanese-related sulfurtransferase